MEIMTVTALEITYEDAGSNQEVPLETFSEVTGMELVNDSAYIGTLHYYVTYSNGIQRKTSWPKNEFSNDWGYIIENFLQGWIMVYKWVNKKDIHTGIPFKRYENYYEMLEDKLGPEMANGFREMPLDYMTEHYGPPFEPIDECADFAEQMDMYFEHDPLNSKERMLAEGQYFDHFLEEWIDIRQSIAVMQELIKKIY